MESSYSPSRLENHLCMKGTIRTKERCPKCGKTFSPTLHPVTRDVIWLSCDVCGLTPHFYYIDVRDMGVPKIYTDMNGYKYDSFGFAHRNLEAMRRDWDEKKFDPSQWVPGMRKTFLIDETCCGWLAYLKLTVSYSHYQHCRGTMELHVKPVLKSIRLVDTRDIRTIHVDAVYLALLDAGYEKKTVRNYMQHFHEYCLYWFNREVLHKMPIFPEVTVPDKYRPWIDKEKQLLILSKVPDDGDNRLLIETFLQGGHRPSELIAHFKRDLEDGQLVVHQAFDAKGKLKPPKSGKIKRRTVSESLWSRLLKHCEEKSPDDFIFIRSGGQPYSYDAFYHLWTDATKLAGVKIPPQAGARRSKVSQERERLEKEMKRKLQNVLEHDSDAYKAYARDRNEKI